MHGTHAQTANNHSSILNYYTDINSFPSTPDWFVACG